MPLPGLRRRARTSSPVSATRISTTQCAMHCHCSYVRGAVALSLTVLIAVSKRPGQGAVSMQRCWQLLAAVAADALAMPASQHGARKAALLQGSLQYLQRGHAAYMQTIIQSHRSEVRPCSAVTASLQHCGWLTGQGQRSKTLSHV